VAEPASNDDPLAAARLSAERGALEQTREHLIRAWRLYRSPEIAELVDVLETETPSPLQETLGQIVRPRVRESLEQLDRLVGVDDPRISGFAIELLASLPFTTPNAQAFLARLIDIVVGARDVRLVARAPGITSSLRVRITRAPVRDALLRQLETVVWAMSVPDLPSSVAQELRVLTTLLAPLGAERRRADSLLASIYEDPEDDMRRLVFGDWLATRGDPRGEFIQLQMQRREGVPSAEAIAREAALLKASGRRWLGSLGSVLSFGPRYAKTTFERGFVSKADIILSVGKKLIPLLTDPAWATVEHLVGFYSADLIEAAPLRALRSLERVITKENVRALALRSEPLRRVETITMRPPFDVDPAELFRAFPGLQEATLHITEAGELADASKLGIPRLVVPVATENWEVFTRHVLELPVSGASIELTQWRSRGSLRRRFRALEGVWIQEPDEEGPRG
jgi:uncharacterized protein (TIGR02996 family)